MQTPRSKASSEIADMMASLGQARAASLILRVRAMPEAQRHAALVWLALESDATRDALAGALRMSDWAAGR